LPISPLAVRPAPDWREIRGLVDRGAWLLSLMADFFWSARGRAWGWESIGMLSRIATERRDARHACSRGANGLPDLAGARAFDIVGQRADPGREIFPRLRCNDRIGRRRSVLSARFDLINIALGR